MWFNTFDEVVKAYNNTKVLVSQSHKIEQDIRPIGARSKKYERIIKYDENTYALTDGNYESSLYSGSSGNKVDPMYSKAMSPILWERKKSGDFVTLRNGTIGSAHISRYKFLDMYMPRGMTLSIHQGKQTVFMRGGVGYQLPKTQYTWDWSNSKVRHEDDGMKLCFKVLGDGEYERVGEVLKTTVNKVDKDAKKKHKALTKEFFDWMCAIVPMLDHSWNATSMYRDQLKQWADDNKIYRRYWSLDLNEIPVDKAIEIMASEDHEMRIPLAMAFNSNMGIQNATDETKAKRAKMAYNRNLNKVFKLYETVEV
jgi:hypothetical protein